MSSTLSSTSDFSFDDEQYSDVMEETYRVHGIPFSTALTQPFIYYAEVPSHRRLSQGSQRKRKRNCFSRAFKWYIQERQCVPISGRISPELSNFATWLDSKYLEYLRESEAGPLAQGYANESICPPCSDNTQPPIKHRKFARIRNPWNRRSSKGENKIKGDQQNVSKSTSALVRNSPDTLTSVELKSSKKTVVKSRSTTSVNCEEEIYSKQNWDDDSAPCVQCNNAAENIFEGCDVDCKYNQQHKIGIELQKALEQIQNPKVSCDTVKEIQQRSVETQKHKVPCGSNYVNIPEEKRSTSALIREVISGPTKDARNIPSNSQVNEISCGSNYILNSKHKTGVKMPKTPVKQEELEVSCSCYEPPKQKNIDKTQQNANISKKCRGPCGAPVLENQTVTKLQQVCPETQTDITVTCSCPDVKEKEIVQIIPKQETIVDPSMPKTTVFEAGQEIRNVPVKPQNTVNSCEASCKGVPKLKEETQRKPALTEVDTYCDPTCNYLPKYKTDEQVQGGTCDTNCPYIAELKTMQQARHMLAKQQIIENACENSCMGIPEYKNKEETQYIQAQEPNVSCDRSCTHNEELRSYIEVQRAPGKIQVMDTFCDSSCEYYSKGKTRPKPSCSINPEINTTTEIPAVFPRSVEKTNAQNCRTKQDNRLADKIKRPQKNNNPCDRDITSEYNKNEVVRICSKTQKDQSSQCLEYKQPTLCECPGYALNSNQTASAVKYVLVPENSIIYNTPAQCECRKQIPSKLKDSNNTCECPVVVKKPSAPIEVQPCSSSTQHAKITNKTVSSTKLSKKIKTADASCQYSVEDIIVKLDALSQYEQSNYSYYYDPACVCAQAENLRSTSNIQRPADTCSTRNIVNARKLCRSLSIFRSDGVQTSDHSLRLQNDAGHDYAFFMKIVCADKLNECACDKNV